MGSEDDADKDDKPSLRQKLNWATGDRDREAEALADSSPEGVTKHDAKVAVARAHGDDGVSEPEIEEPAPEDEIAKPSDAEKVKEERSG
jgi:hypothetical protein